jgi:hypothetical protein
MDTIFGRQNDEPLTQQELLSRLSRANGFRLDCLEKNRDGILSLWQISILFTRSILNLLGAGFGIYVASQATIDLGKIQSHDLVFLLAGLFIIGLLLFRGGTRLADAWTGKVLFLEGSMWGFRQRYSKGTSYYYVVDDVRFRVSRRAYKALPEGMPCRVYYTPRAKVMVNIEPI